MAESPVEKLVADAAGVIRERTETFCSHWHEMYDLSGDQLQNYCSKIKAHISVLLDDIETQIMRKKSCLATKIEECMNKKIEIEKELGKPGIPPDFPEGTPLMVIIKALEEQLEDYGRERAQRLVVVEKLKEEELTLCNLLDEPPFLLSRELPSAEEVDALRFRVDELEILKIQRREELGPLQIRLRELMTKLEQEPNNEMEKALLQNDVESLPITGLRLREAKELVEKKFLELKYAEEEMAHLRAELARLWDRIDVPEAYRTQFMDIHLGIGRAAKEAFLNEKERCEIIKRQTIQPIIEKLRRDIVEHWNLLALTEQQRCNFSAFHTNVLNEDVLDLHEMELARLQTSYLENKQLLELAEERRRIKEEYEKLEERSTNPNRLKNRGGTLLIEEKERKSLMRSLVKVESSLKAALVSYYEAHDTPFLWWGEDLLQKITQDEVEHPTRTTPRKAVSIRRDNLMSRSSSKSSYTTLSTESISSYSQFQEQIELGSSVGRPTRATPQRCTPRSASKRLCTPVTRSATSRLPLRQIQPSPYYTRAHSSPTTPKRFGLARPSPRRVTPKRFGMALTKSSLHF